METEAFLKGLFASKSNKSAIVSFVIYYRLPFTQKPDLLTSRQKTEHAKNLFHRHCDAFISIQWPSFCFNGMRYKRST